MLPLEFRSPLYLWWYAWKKHVRNAKKYPEQADGYCKAAAIANAMYVICVAEALAKENRKCE